MRIRKAVERWFPVPEDEDGTRIKIKHLSPGEKAEIYDKVFVQQVNYTKDEEGSLKPNFSQETNKQLDRELTVTKSIVDWEKMLDHDEQEMECTPENIVKALNEIEGFNLLIGELRKKLADEIEQEQEHQRKNSQGSVSDSKK